MTATPSLAPRCPSCLHQEHAGQCRTPSEYGCPCRRRITVERRVYYLPLEASDA